MTYICLLVVVSAIDASPGRRPFGNATMTIMANLLDRITIEPDKRGGKPCIRGLRITVYDVLEYLASGMTEKELLSDFPDLESDDIRAVLQFAAERERRLSATRA